MAKILGLAAAVLLALAVGTAFRLPREAEAERSITIERPRDEVFQVLNSFDRFNEWAPWAAKDPGAIYTHEGPAAGAAATLRFEGSPWTIGSGYHRIVVSVHGRQVTMEHELGSHRAVSKLVLTEQPAGGTAVAWHLALDMGMSPISRWRGLGLEGELDRDCASGLAALKVLVERTPPAASDILGPHSARGGTDAP